MDRRPLFTLLLALLFCCPLVVLAQQETATITGEVRDAAGAVVPGASLTVTNVGTNISLKAETNEQGIYTVPSLKPGPYSIAVEKAGFKKVIRSGVTLQVNQTARIDIALQVGEMTNTVEVVGAATLLETETSSRGSVIDGKKIVDLPLNGRDYNQLALLSPGVLPTTPRLASVNFKGAFNVNGNRTFNNVFLLDGVDNISYSNSFRGENVQLVQPSIEALQEFKIQTNAYSAEFGRSSGALINAVIKSGTNSVHGSAYEFHRNRALDASNFFSNKSGAPKPFRLRNQFGAAVGGP
ncbi:MAG: carboxypeptidase regulatory-like domain-containing protein, partial [Blastocatellia bacterium]